jgi:hypothetical protein
MITVPEAAEKIVKRSRYLNEALSKDIINISSLARYIKPEIEEMLIKKVSLSSIIMALKRIDRKNLPDTPYDQIFSNPPEITVKPNLALLLSDERQKAQVSFVYSTLTEEDSILLGKKEDLTKLKTDKSQLIYPVSAISIPVPSEAKGISGIYYFFIKSFAWERINILNFFTSANEICLVVGEENLQRSLEIVRGLFKDQLIDSIV